VYFGERVNALAGQHWQAFAGQDYFDSHGIFYSIMVSGPAVFNLVAVLVRGWRPHSTILLATSTVKGCCCLRCTSDAPVRGNRAAA
jgi:hypothetical protein